MRARVDGESQVSRRLSDSAGVSSVAEPRKLGLGGKALVALMVAATAGLGVGLWAAMRAKRIEDEKRLLSTTLLTRTGGELRPVGMFGQKGYCYPPERADGSGADPTGQHALFTHMPQTWSHPSVPGDEFTCPVCVYTRDVEFGGLMRDAWGNPIYYRCPGPIHNNGWDLISCGPNGVFENGGGDDIVVGEDIPGGLAAIASSR
ncbi:MAG TPA: hypothetical protein VKT78_19360 [Fimbriimonadaceae bacterium]|nr:hypothetical protein [Fimbriimonadaceae bacterium]